MTNPPTSLRRLAALACGLSLLVAACGSESSTATDDTTAAPTSTTDDTSAAETPTDSDASVRTSDDSSATDGAKPEVVVPAGPAPTELEFDDLIVGEGATAADGDYLVMQYVGVRHADGGQFDASWDRGQPFSFTLGAGMVIQGWDQGIAGMQEGGRRLLNIPSDLAYGSQARGADIPADSALVFVVDLISVVRQPTVENAPEPVTELDVEVLSEGSGEVIEAGDVVEVHYIAMLQTNGEVFDSTWSRGQTAQVVIGVDPPQVIEAWNDGLLGRRAGDHVRLVIPPGMGIDDPSGAIPADATIITEVNIVSVN